MIAARRFMVGSDERAGIEARLRDFKMVAIAVVLHLM
jgi:hypothetical protein